MYYSCLLCQVVVLPVWSLAQTCLRRLTYLAESSILYSCLSCICDPPTKPLSHPSTSSFFETCRWFDLRCPKQHCPQFKKNHNYSQMLLGTNFSKNLILIKRMMQYFLIQDYLLRASLTSRNYLVSPTAYHMVLLLNSLVVLC